MINFATNICEAVDNYGHLTGKQLRSPVKTQNTILVILLLQPFFLFKAVLPAYSDPMRNNIFFK